MKRLALIWLSILLPAAGVIGEVTASLEVADRQDRRLGPYATARLGLTNATDQAVEAVLLRPAGGGPTVRHALAIAAGQEHTATVALPAISPVQKYQVTALAADGQALGRAWADITWPAEHVAADVFLDDAYALWSDAKASFDPPTRRSALLLLAIFVTVAAAALLIHRGPLRLAALGVLVAAGAGGVIFVPAWPEPVQAGDHHLLLYRGDELLETDSFTVLAARRTARVRRKAQAVPYPVYPDRAAAGADDAQVDPAECSIELTAPCGGVRIISPAGEIQGDQRPAPAGLAIRAEGDCPIIEGSFAYPVRFALRNDWFWAIPGRSARIKAPLTANSGGRISRVLSSPGRHRLAAEHARLLRYWQGKYQQAGRTYLLGVDRPGGRFRMVVVELPPAKPASAPAGAAS